LDLIFIHGNVVDEDDVAEVRDGSSTKEAFGFLQKEFVLLQLVKDQVDMAKVPCPQLAIYQYIIKENEDEPVKE
jgi:hypothetical protein